MWSAWPGLISNQVVQPSKADPLACKGLSSANLANLPIRQLWMVIFEINNLPTLFVGCWVSFGVKHLAAMALKLLKQSYKDVQSI